MAFRSVGGLLEEIDIFEDPHKDDENYYQPSDDLEGGGKYSRAQVKLQESCGKPLTEEDLKELDPHKKAILVKQITSRVHETLTLFDEETRDEMADLKALEDQSSRAQMNRLIRAQETRSKKIQDLIISSVGENTMNLQQDAKWAEEETNIIEEQQLQAVEVQNSEDQVISLLQMCTETTEGASNRLENILKRLQVEIDTMRDRAKNKLDSIMSQFDAKDDISKTQLDTLRELLQKADDEKKVMSNSQSNTKEHLKTLQQALKSTKESFHEESKKLKSEKMRADKAEEKVKTMDEAFASISEEAARLKIKLQEFEGIKSEKKLLKETQAKLAVAENRVSTLMTTKKALTSEIASVSAEVEKQRRLLDSLEERLSEEKEKTSQMTARQSEQAKENANLGAKTNQRIVSVVAFCASTQP